MRSHRSRHVRFFVPIPARPPMHVRVTDLLALRIVVVLAHVETTDATHRLQNERECQGSGAPIVAPLDEERPTMSRLDLGTKLPSRRVVLVCSPFDAVPNALLRLQDQSGLGIGQRHRHCPARLSSHASAGSGGAPMPTRCATASPLESTSALSAPRISTSHSSPVSSSTSSFQLATSVRGPVRYSLNSPIWRCASCVQRRTCGSGAMAACSGMGGTLTSSAFSLAVPIARYVIPTDSDRPRSPKQSP